MQDVNDNQATLPTIEQLRGEDNDRIPASAAELPTACDAFLDRVAEHVPLHVQHVRAVEEEMFDDMKHELYGVLSRVLKKYADPEKPDLTHLVYHVVTYDNICCLLAAIMADNMPPAVAAGIAQDMAARTAARCGAAMFKELLGELSETAGESPEESETEVAGRSGTG